MRSLVPGARGFFFFLLSFYKIRGRIRVNPVRQRGGEIRRKQARDVQIQMLITTRVKAKEAWSMCGCRGGVSSQ